MSLTRIKNCGLQDAEALNAAAESGAEFAGFIHYPQSSRYIATEDAATLTKPAGIKAVAVFVNPTDDELQHAVSLNYADYIQLHGDESPERAAEVKARFGLPVIKAVGIAGAEDVMQLAAYDAVADHLLLDTKSTEYGGTGETFDWTLLQGLQVSNPWFLSGGLSLHNIAQAIQTTHAPIVDVSSGIEREKGVKDIAMIREFNQAAQHAK